MEFVLVVLDDERDGVQRVAAVGGLVGVLQVEILDRDVVVAELEAAAFFRSPIDFSENFFAVAFVTATTSESKNGVALRTV